MVQSGFWNLRVQSEPVVVAVAPDQGPKTGLNRTFKHYMHPPLLFSVLVLVLPILFIVVAVILGNEPKPKSVLGLKYRQS